ncbi:MAG: Do family serine endopeptidase [Deltaproteobacteria bacterium]|nr:Do family serine endopeptidase [Deltaproteobacteria bacterium]
MSRTQRTKWGTGLGLATLALIAVVACGATAAKKEGASPGTATPMAPVAYDPNVSLAPLIEKVSPAVVNVRTTSEVDMRDFMGRGGIFEWFFGPRGPGMGPGMGPGIGPGPGPGERQVQRSLGSGILVDKDGLVVTNHHVVKGADDIEVQVSDDRVFKAQVVGSDERTDVALLKLEKASGLPVAVFGDSEGLRVGDRVVAIGNPFGLDHTVTEGIVSAKERVIGAGPYDEFIQTDASINPGNSGGPLFNLKGEVVGINTAIAPQGQGIGFAIPSNLARSVIDSLRDGGRVVRGWLGIAFQPLDEDLAKAFGTKDTHGAVVANVTPGSPAEKAGLKGGDVIVEVGGKALKDASQLPSLVASRKPGEVVPVVVVRDGKRRTIDVTVGELQEGEKDGRAPVVGRGSDKDTGLGLTVAPLDETSRKRLGADGVDGVVVTDVRPGSPASRVLTRGDVVAEVNREKVTTPADLQAKTKGLKAGDDVLFLVLRDGSWLYLVTRL